MELVDLWRLIAAHWKAIVAVATPLGALVGTAIAGYLTYRGWAVAYQNNSRLEQEKNLNAINLEKRKAELAFVSDQIRHLYGPLTALCETRRAAFRALMHDRGRKDFFDGSKLAPDELRQWRLWRTEVLMPLVVQMEAAILSNGHLIEGAKMPASFFKLLAHVASYKAVIKNWDYAIQKDKEAGTQIIDEQKQTSDKEYWPVIPHVGVDNFPNEFHVDVARTFENLKAKQAHLIKSTQQENSGERQVAA